MSSNERVVPLRLSSLPSLTLSLSLPFRTNQPNFTDSTNSPSAPTSSPSCTSTLNSSSTGRVRLGKGGWVRRLFRVRPKPTQLIPTSFRSSSFQTDAPPCSFGLARCALHSYLPHLDVQAEGVLHWICFALKTRCRLRPRTAIPSLFRDRLPQTHTSNLPTVSPTYRSNGSYLPSPLIRSLVPLTRIKSNASTRKNLARRVFSPQVSGVWIQTMRLKEPVLLLI